MTKDIGDAFLVLWSTEAVPAGEKSSGPKQQWAPSAENDPGAKNACPHQTANEFFFCHHFKSGLVAFFCRVLHVLQFMVTPRIQKKRSRPTASSRGELERKKALLPVCFIVAPPEPVLRRTLVAPSPGRSASPARRVAVRARTGDLKNRSHITCPHTHA